MFPGPASTKSGGSSNPQTMSTTLLQQLNASDSSFHLSTFDLLATLSPANESFGASTGDILTEALQVSADLEQFILEFYEEEEAQGQHQQGGSGSGSKSRQHHSASGRASGEAKQ
jgi:hypothetical protein